MVSILDIIGTVIAGPSSSHTAGARRIGLLTRGLVGGTPPPLPDEKVIDALAAAGSIGAGSLTVPRFRAQEVAVRQRRARPPAPRRTGRPPMADWRPLPPGAGSRASG